MYFGDFLRLTFLSLLLYTQDMKTVSKPVWDLPAAALLMALVLTSAGRLGATRWIPDLERVQTLAVIATLLGLALGQSLFQPRIVTLLAAGYTIVLIPLELAQVMDPGIELGERLMGTGVRLLDALSVFSRGEAVEDPILFLTLMAVLFWGIGLLSGYALIRKSNYLAAVLPGGLVIIVIQTYDYYAVKRIGFLAFYVFLALVLLGRMNYLHKQEIWRQKNIFLVPETGLDLTSGAAVAAAVVVLMAWLLPGISNSALAARAWEQVTQPWQIMRERLSDAFASAKGSGGSSNEFFGEQMSLGTGVPLGGEVMFRVHVSESKHSVPRYYWRGRVYDYYENYQWHSTAQPFQTFQPEQDLLSVLLDGQQWQDFTFTVFTRQRTLYVPNQPLWVSRRAGVRSFLLPDGAWEVVYLRASESLSPGEVYQARAALVSPTIAELRAAGDDYPAWVIERYLQLPDNFSPRIRSLALEVSASAKTPYDKTVAITDYLRQEIRYAPTIPPPPPGRDPLEYVLFDLKRGFCNYYASAEVLMLRSLGIPARMAVGFAEGQAELGRRNFTVLQRDAHAWPEVYFPGIGWVEFEPTANQDSFVRPAGVERTNGRLNPLLPQPERDNGNPPERPLQQDVGTEVADGSNPNLRLLLTSGIPLALTAALLFAFWHLNRRYALLEQTPARLIDVLERQQASVPVWLRNWDLYMRAGPLGRAFEWINLSLRWLGEPPPVHATPAQRARVLCELMPVAAENIQTLAGEYQASLYGQRLGDVHLARRMARLLILQTLRTVVRRRFNDFLNRF